MHHVVMWRLQDEAKRTHLSVLTNQMQALASVMRKEVPGLLRMELRGNRSTAPDASDLLLYSEFESWHALQAYEAHSLHLDLRSLIFATAQ